MRGIFAAIAVGLGVAFGALACSGDDERPARDEDPACEPDDPTCGNISGPVGGGSSPTGTDAAAPASDASTGDDLTTIIGNLNTFTDDGFENVTLFTGEGSVFAEAPGGNFVIGSAGVSEFELADVLLGPLVWVGFMPDFGSNLLTTLMPFDTTVSGRLDLAVARATTIDAMLSGLTQAVTRDEGAAQVVMFFVDPSGNPAANVTVLPVTIEQPIAYRIGGVWTDESPTGTDESGMAMAVNVWSNELPGLDTPIRFTTPTDSTPDVRYVLTVAGGVTVAALPSE